MPEQNTDRKSPIKPAVEEKCRRVTIEVSEELYNQIKVYPLYLQSAHESQTILSEAEIINECVEKVLNRDRKFQDWCEKQSEFVQ